MSLARFALRTVARAPVVARSMASFPNAPLDPADTQVGITGRIPDEVEQVTGIERRELYKLMDGVEDPFGMAMEPKYGPRGTIDAPRMVPSHFESRLVGICDEDSEQIHFFELKSGDVQCVNGEYFQLLKVHEDDISH